MAWAALTVDDIKTRLSGPELNSLQSSALAAGQNNPLPEVIAQVTDEIRGYIRPRGTLGPEGTLPPQVFSAALAIIRWRVMGRMSVGSAGLILQSEPRRKEYEDAMALIKDIGAGRFVVETPDTESAQNFDAPRSKFGSDDKMEF
ncbi:MAG: hypothetical protein ABS95_01425 [Verrucomicrobia bacterium SCN 57-15]|nr:MAG: hypothetical protein ABS95_01425 [Verrucomicrobia bacterium SCN 57-15]